MSEVIDLHTKKIKAKNGQKVNKYAIKAIRDILERMESGEIRSFIIVTENKTEGLGQAWALSNKTNVFAMLGALSICKRDFMEVEID